MRPILPLVSLAALGLLSACGPKEPPKPPERVISVTTAAVVPRDLAITESAVGSATSLSVAQALDPTRVHRTVLSIRLPFPEHVARRLKVGQAVRLTSFDDPGRTATARVREIRPALDSSTQSMEVIAELPAGREWYSLGSVRGEVTLGVRRGALVVPEQAVVLRLGPVEPGRALPGTVSAVYVPDGERVGERIVTTGLRRDGVVEITSGLEAGETVVVDGAGVLGPGARIRVAGAGGAP